jgi:hypothetical protein
MNFLHYRKHMFNYFEADLSPLLKEEIEQHLQQCASCRRQYDLTRMENQILQDTSNIPALDAEFNGRVMNLIANSGEHSAAIMSSGNPRRYRWRPVYSQAVVAVALLAICFYIPGMIPERQGDQALQRTVSPIQSHASVPEDVQQNPMKAKVAYAGNLKISNNLDKCESPEILQSSPEVQTAPLPTTDQQLAGSGFRANSLEPTRSVQPESSTTKSAYAGSIGLQNIPVKFILLHTNQLAENQVEYSYGTQDGSQNLLIRVLLPDHAKEAAIAYNLSTVPPAVNNLNNTVSIISESKREIELDGKSYQLVVSGNFSQEEIDHLANNISLRQEP